jgi:UDP-3-O-[3-hydroxymyristoyl] glucosamine N-acyltransferase
LITKSVTEPGVYTSSIPSQPHRIWMNTLAALRGLPELTKVVRALEARRGATRQEDGTP